MLGRRKEECCDDAMAVVIMIGQVQRQERTKLYQYLVDNRMELQGVGTVYLPLRSACAVSVGS